MKSEKDLQQSVNNLTVESGDRIHARNLDKLLKKLDESKSVCEKSSCRSVVVIGKVSKIAAALLVISSLAACYVLFGKVADLKDDLARAQREIAIARKDVALNQPDDTTTINLYLKEHRDVVARHASLTRAAQQPAKLSVNQHDVLYYEFLDDEREYLRPGIIVRGPSSEREIGSSKAPVISNGHTLTLFEARQAAGFDLVAPSWLHPGYVLEEIRRIDGRDALQLLYTNGINSVSLFEQPLDGQRGLEAKDFREYAVLCNKKQAGATILAWKDNELSYVLIGNTEMSKLMDMAQAISAGR